MTRHENQHVPRPKTHIEGFDLIALGGLPARRTMLVSGTSGSAKTAFACQFLAAGILDAREPGVFVTFEEPAADIRLNRLSFGWSIEQWEAEGKWVFVDASPQVEVDPRIFTGRYELGAPLARVEHAIRRVGATRVAVDSIGGVFDRLDQMFRE